MEYSKITFIVSITIWFCVTISFTRAVEEQIDAPVISVSGGQLLGTVLKSRNGRTYFGFLGVEYAAQPERFEVSGPVENWEGVKNATDFGSACPHNVFASNEFRGNENCLTLNIYTSKVSGKMPVLVYFHGGGFMWGDSSGYGAKYFMDEEVVLVTANYRLGILGFLSTQDDVIPGNLGLKDQTQSLRWIRTNIANFGGDVNKVTIFGESAGAASVNFHLLSPMSKGLFSRAISQSGSALQPLALQRNPIANVKKVASILDCPWEYGKQGSEKFKACLKAKTTKEIVDAQKQFKNDVIELPSPFSPSVEKVSPESEIASTTFLSHSPYRLLTDKKLKHKLNIDVPWIIGLCKDEGLSLAGGALNDESEFGIQMAKALKENRSTGYPMALLYEDTARIENWQLIADTIHKFYFGDKKIGKETAQELSNLFGDRWNNHGVRSSAKLAAKQGFRVYPYVFSFTGNFSFSEFFGVQPGYKGVIHMDDLPYLFNMTLFSLRVPEMEHESKIISQTFVKLWTSFANTGGVPTLPTMSADKKWEAIDIDDEFEPRWYIIDQKSQMGEAPFSSRMKFWDDLPMLLEMEREVDHNHNIPKDEL